ncbi:MAG: RluA family pseudouridine synthase [Saprospiraceae bacterium]|nr:RluA family pseudouridine synthase [Saprospiraceae bacterium]MBK8669897.1 RluA family pseudouridine synthase [Saprospiraceae bacterium]MBL0100986.1 RluA family pseudouridine synthase [Saprospiraceae bacterium]
MRRDKTDLQGLSVIYEDNHLIAINKPAGALVHGDETGDKTLADSVKQYIKIRYNKPGDVFLGVIHRLDRPVSGVVIFARTSKALIRMNKMLQEKTIQKTYLAIVSSRPEELSGTLTHFISKDETKNIVKAYASKRSGAKEAILTYTQKGELDGKILLEVHPLTGRPHQIRAQLSKINCPIIGDLKYGATYPLPDQSIALHCHQMSFVHPVKEETITIKAHPPRIFPWNIFSIG